MEYGALGGVNGNAIDALVRETDDGSSHWVRCKLCSVDVGSRVGVIVGADGSRSRHRE